MTLRPATVWHTVRHLRPVQLYGRVWFRAHRPAPDFRPSPPRRTADGPWAEPARRRPSLVGPAAWVLLGERRDLDTHGWDDPALDKLWRYNQHYFDDLAACGAAGRSDWHQALVARWVRENPPAGGSGWEPYPTSLRLVNWVKWALAGGPLPDAGVESLAVQARWLTRRLEVHLLGNHLFVNAKALVFAGAFFRGAEADRWLARGLGLLAREVPEQVLADGGQFERTPMYHALALDDVLDLVNVARAYPGVVPDVAVAGWSARVPDMLAWLAALTHPDGEIAFFNDAATGVAPSPGELAAYAGRLGFAPPAAQRGVQHLRPSGFARAARGPAVLVADVGSVGPAYLPAHAHAGTLSFELSLGRDRVVVNSGTSRYGAGPERARERGTAAHSTVVVDGADSSEVWGGFRVGRRARVTTAHARAEPNACVIEAAHDGYRRLTGRVTHARRWTLDDGGLTVEDRLDGRWHAAEARFHLHPGLTVAAAAADALTLHTPEGRTVQVRCDGGALAVEPSTWHAAFGTGEPTRCVVARFTTAAVRTSWRWDAA